MTNDIFRGADKDEKTRLRISRIGMLLSSVVILVIAMINPPQIFIIMYFGGTVIASSWGPVALASIWSKTLSKTGAFLGMICGFIICVTTKIISGFVSFEWPIYFDPFILGIAAGVLGMVIGSKWNPVGEKEIMERTKLFVVPQKEKSGGECQRTIKTGYIYILFGVILTLFFLLTWALPYNEIL